MAEADKYKLCRKVGYKHTHPSVMELFRNFPRGKNTKTIWYTSVLLPHTADV